MRPHERLELEWGQLTGRPNMVACSSGTTALHLALETLCDRWGWSAGAQVLVPDYCMVSAARAVVLAGLSPVFVDCGPDLLMDMGLLNCLSVDATVYPESGLHDSRRVVAALPVHVYGRRCGMETLYTWAKARGVAVVEDCCQFHGGTLGGLSDAWCWSFQSTKIVAGEEGGAVAFREGPEVQVAKSLRDCGFNPERNYRHRPRGHNYRLADCLAEMVYSPRFSTSLKGYAANSVLRREIETWYDGACPPEWRMPGRECVWVYDLRVPEMTGCQQARVVMKLRAAGVKAGYGFRPMSSQEEFQSNLVVARSRDYASEAAATEVIALPVRPGEMGREDCRRAIGIIRAELGQDWG